jgi:hypothetical protein
MPREFVHPLVASVTGGSIELEPPCPWTSRLSEHPSQLHSDGIVPPPRVRDYLFLRSWLLFAPSRIFFFSFIYFLFFCVVNEAQLLVVSHRRRQSVRTNSGLVACRPARAF